VCVSRGMMKLQAIALKTGLCQNRRLKPALLMPRALGTVIVGGVDQPAHGDVLCIRADQTSPSRISDSPVWRHEAGSLQGLQRLKSYHVETWRCSCWQVDNDCRTFIAVRQLSRPASDVALSASGDEFK